MTILEHRARYFLNFVQDPGYLGCVPRDTLTREQILKAAIDLLDAEGLEGLNMRALGNLLGSAATAVYWHIGSKENLLALAGDQVWNEIPLPDLTATERAPPPRRWPPNSMRC